MAAVHGYRAEAPAPASVPCRSRASAAPRPRRTPAGRRARDFAPCARRACCSTSYPSMRPVRSARLRMDSMARRSCSNDARPRRSRAPYSCSWRRNRCSPVAPVTEIRHCALLRRWHPAPQPVSACFVVRHRLGNRVFLHPRAIGGKAEILAPVGQCTFCRRCGRNSGEQHDNGKHCQCSTMAVHRHPGAAVTPSPGRSARTARPMPHAGTSLHRRQDAQAGRGRSRRKYPDAPKAWIRERSAPDRARR